jgi:hypothetical protein
MASDDPTRSRALIAGYANYFEVGHNAFEFLIDFGQIDPQSGDVNINSRVAVGPTHAKLFSRLLQGAVAQFEVQFGQIPEVRDEDLLGAALDPSPEFERRAIDARRRPVAAAVRPGPVRPGRAKASQKR